MKYRNWLIILISLLFVMGCVFIAYLLIPLRLNYLRYEPTRITEEERILHDVSNGLGLEASWDAVREHVYCNLLKKDMTREDVESELSKVGKIRSRETEIDFENQVLDYYLGPIMVNFDGLGPSGKLQSWGSSPEHNFGAPRSSCEINGTK